MGRTGVRDVSDEKKYWFPTKRYGWGWGWPAVWQGWACFGMFFAGLVIAAVTNLPHRPGLFTVWVLALCVPLVLVCWLKGEPPRWRWGD
jgi:hypothetical protein